VRVVRVSEPVLRAPFPWFGGKRKIAAEVWSRFGNVDNYVEPFFGSGAVLLARPQPFRGNETINDFDGLVANCWRSLKLSPELVAEWADNPVNENDLHARHIWLLGELPTLPARLEGSPDWHDPKIAGWWLWGVACWIGSGFCSGKGPWTVEDGLLVNGRQLPHLGDNGRGVNRKLPHLGDNGRGVNRKRPHLGDNGRGVNRQRPHLGDNGRGVNRKRPHLGDNGRGAALVEWFLALSERLARVRVCCGDWSRVCGPSVTFKHGLTGVLLDPPYADSAARTSDLYRCDSESVAHAVRGWAIENGRRDDMRIALCGYEGEHEMPEAWAVHEWNAGQGFGGQAAERSGNGRRERIWFSPACVRPVAAQGSLFARVPA
jgi:DNA adenine methylase